MADTRNPDIPDDIPVFGKQAPKKAPKKAPAKEAPSTAPTEKPTAPPPRSEVGTQEHKEQINAKHTIDGLLAVDKLHHLINQMKDNEKLTDMLLHHAFKDDKKALHKADEIEGNARIINFALLPENKDTIDELLKDKRLVAEYKAYRTPAFLAQLLDEKDEAKLNALVRSPEFTSKFAAHYGIEEIPNGKHETYVLDTLKQLTGAKNDSRNQKITTAITMGAAGAIGGMIGRYAMGSVTGEDSANFLGGSTGMLVRVAVGAATGAALAAVVTPLAFKLLQKTGVTEKLSNALQNRTKGRFKAPSKLMAFTKKHPIATRVFVSGLIGGTLSFVFNSPELANSLDKFASPFMDVDSIMEFEQPTPRPEGMSEPASRFSSTPEVETPQNNPAYEHTATGEPLWNQVGRMIDNSGVEFENPQDRNRMIRAALVDIEARNPGIDIDNVPKGADIKAPDLSSKDGLLSVVQRVPSTGNLAEVIQTGQPSDFAYQTNAPSGAVNGPGDASGAGVATHVYDETFKHDLKRDLDSALNDIYRPREGDADYATRLHGPNNIAEHAMANGGEIDRSQLSLSGKRVYDMVGHDAVQDMIAQASSSTPEGLAPTSFDGKLDQSVATAEQSIAKVEPKPAEPSNTRAPRLR